MVVGLKRISERHIRFICRRAAGWCIERKIRGIAPDPDLMLYRNFETLSGRAAFSTREYWLGPANVSGLCRPSS
jgi:hypothetical protein